MVKISEAGVKEEDVKAQVREIFKGVQKDLLSWDMNVPYGYGVQGIADFTCAVRVNDSYYAAYVAFECKRNKRQPLRPSQKLWRAKFVAAGGLYYIIHDENVPLVQVALDQILHGYAPLPSHAA
jgi:hypothetical protein